MGKEINQVIARLSRIEDASVEVVNRSEQEKKQYAALMEQKTKDFDTSLAKETEIKLAKIKIDLEAQSANDLANLRKETNEELARIDESFETNHSKMAKQIFENMIRI